MNSVILIQEVLPGSIADKYSLVSRGDKILSIDGQLLDGADYIMYVLIARVSVFKPQSNCTCVYLT